MDTIAINIDVKHCMGDICIERLKMGVNNIQSEFGFTYVDFLKMNSNTNFTLKVSYPRYYKGINAYLVNTSYEVLRVNQNLVSQLNSIFTQIGIIDYTINLIRVDIPFTYIKPCDLDFYAYGEVFRLMCISYVNTRQSKKGKSSNTTGIIEMISKKLETVNFTNNSGNIEVCIYNQYLNILRKTSDPQMINQFSQLYPDLVNRIRIEVRKRVQRNEFLPLEFANFDVLGEYLPQHKNFILKYLFNKKVFENTKNEYIYRLDNTYKAYIQRHRRINYEAWVLENINHIVDYSIIREVLVRNIPNKKTLENAITVVRRVLKNINPMYNNVFKSLDSIKKAIVAYSPTEPIQDWNLNRNNSSGEIVTEVINREIQTWEENITDEELEWMVMQQKWNEFYEQYPNEFYYEHYEDEEEEEYQYVPFDHDINNYI